MTHVTQKDVVKATIEQIEKRGGFTTANYFQTGPSGSMLINPGPDVGSTCAVGGVEQAIWRLTGERGDERARRYLKNSTRPIKGNLFASVMAKLNRKARELYGDLSYSFDGRLIETIEQITFVGSDRIARKRVLIVLRAVLDDLNKTKAEAEAVSTPTP